MTTLPMPLPLGVAAVRYVKAHPVFAALVADGLIGSETGASDPVEAAWLFRGLDDDGRPFRDPEGSGAACVTIMDRASWAGPNMHNTADFPMLQVLVYADSTRNTDGSTITRDATDRARHISNMLHPLFHDVGNQNHVWAGLYVVSSVGASGLSLRDIPATNGECVRAERTYNVVLG